MTNSGKDGPACFAFAFISLRPGRVGCRSEINPTLFLNPGVVLVDVNVPGLQVASYACFFQACGTSYWLKAGGISWAPTACYTGHAWKA